MPVFRIEKNENYTTMSNYHFKDKRLSLKAKGLLSEMLSLPNDWDYSVAGLVAINKEEETAIKSTLKELKDTGYLVVKKIYPTKETGGKIEYEYIIYEFPCSIQEVEIQEVEIQGVGFLPLEVLPLENQGQLNTNKLNTNKLNTKEQNTKELNIEKENIQKKEKFDAIKVVELNEEISSDSELLQAWKDFIEFRKAVKPIKTMQGFTKLLNKLRDLSNGNHQVMIDILNQSIEKEWLGLFELEKKRTSYKPKQAEDNWDKFMKGEHIESHSEFDNYL